MNIRTKPAAINNAAFPRYSAMVFIVPELVPLFPRTTIYSGTVGSNVIQPTPAIKHSTKAWAFESLTRNLSLSLGSFSYAAKPSTYLVGMPMLLAISVISAHEPVAVPS